MSKISSCSYGDYGIIREIINEYNNDDNNNGDNNNGNSDDNNDNVLVLDMISSKFRRYNKHEKVTLSLDKLKRMKSQRTTHNINYQSLFNQIKNQLYVISQFNMMKTYLCPDNIINMICIETNNYYIMPHKRYIIQLFTKDINEENIGRKIFDDFINNRITLLLYVKSDMSIFDLCYSNEDGNDLLLLNEINQCFRNVIIQLYGKYGDHNIELDLSLCRIHYIYNIDGRLVFQLIYINVLNFIKFTYVINSIDLEILIYFGKTYGSLFFRNFNHEIITSFDDTQLYHSSSSLSSLSSSSLSSSLSSLSLLNGGGFNVRDIFTENKCDYIYDDNNGKFIINRRDYRNIMKYNITYILSRKIVDITYNYGYIKLPQKKIIITDTDAIKGLEYLKSVPKVNSIYVKYHSDNVNFTKESQNYTYDVYYFIIVLFGFLCNRIIDKYITTYIPRHINRIEIIKNMINIINDNNNTDNDIVITKLILNIPDIKYRYDNNLLFISISHIFSYSTISIKNKGYFYGQLFIIDNEYISVVYNNIYNQLCNILNGKYVINDYILLRENKEYNNVSEFLLCFTVRKHNIFKYNTIVDLSYIEAKSIDNIIKYIITYYGVKDYISYVHYPTSQYNSFFHLNLIDNLRFPVVFRTPARINRIYNLSTTYTLVTDHYWDKIMTLLKILYNIDRTRAHCKYIPYICEYD